MTETDLQHLRAAIAIAQRARANGNHPFGALLVDEQGNVILDAENTVLTEQDITGHAELNLIRLASRHYSPDFLARCTLYASTEPCAMCAGAIYWSGVGRVVYALSADRLVALTGRDANRLWPSSREIFTRSGRTVSIEGPAIEDEALLVHTDFWT